MRHALTAFARTPGVALASDLDTPHVAAWVATRFGRNVNGVLSILRCLRTAAAIGVAEGWLERAPQWRRLWPRPGPRVSVRHWSRAQVAGLLEALARSAVDWQGRRLLALVATVAYTGLRKSEALYLHATDVDLTAGVLHVVARRRLKTEASAAPVPIPPELVSILAGWLGEFEGEAVWLFPGVRGKGPWTGGSPGSRPVDRLKAAGEAVGLRGVTFQSLRHTLGKLAVAEFGLSADQTRSVLRHSTTATTEAFYLHRDDVDSLRRIGSRITFRPVA